MTTPPRLTVGLILLGGVLAPILVNAGEAPRQPATKGIDAAAVRRVLTHLRNVAEANARDPKTSKKGDALADLYIGSSAEFCRREKIASKEFVVALGLGLDPADFLRRHPLTRGTFKDLDADAERERRKGVMGEPTLRGRADWLQHFALSAALTATSGGEMAELLGVAKEFQDALEPSGFSFADLAADYAGIAFARHLSAGPDRLGEVGRSFRGDAFLPPIGDLDEGLSLNALQEKYGNQDGERFRAALRGIRERVNDLAVYKSK